MNHRTGTIFALFAATAVACALAGAIAVRVGPVQGAPQSLRVALTRKAADGKGGIALLFTKLPTGYYAVKVFAQQR
jgi:hypothetical protein